ncbi:hypothetical protein HPB47_005728 [Ixodes persulcatus]|uniref:Uncharacterized protein n=1 Tax=Ixodes persulcatus TaxID=34615 RepID=A0AC60PC73_IXOPE|nr:hypothetical protein HPB47_005728 [Ixodes persulcatus]
MNLEKPEARFNNFFSHEAYGLRPKNCVNSQRISMSDVLPSLILSGIVILKRNVVEFAEDGVLFENDKEVYLSSRGGVWMSKRLGPNGMPNDAALSTRAIDLKKRLLPTCMNLEKPEARFNNFFSHEAYGLRPKNCVNSQRISMSDVLPSLILSGIVILKRNVVEFAEDGVLFENDKEVTKLDAVILATGYKIKFPMLSGDVMPAVDKQVQLYKHVFPPALEHPTLAIIGLVMGDGSPLPLIELQARWVAQLLAGKCKLPPHSQMYQDIARERAALWRRFGNSFNTTIYVDSMEYMDDLADKIGASPKMLKYFFTDHTLFRALLGPCVPYQFRLEGPHSWTGARDAILKSQMRRSAASRGFTFSWL